MFSGASLLSAKYHSPSLPSASPSSIFPFRAFAAAVTMTPFSRLTVALSHLAASVLADLLFTLPFAAICSPLLLCHASYGLYTPLIDSLAVFCPPFNVFLNNSSGDLFLMPCTNPSCAPVVCDNEGCVCV